MGRCERSTNGRARRCGLTMAVDPLAGLQAVAPALIRVPGDGSNTISYVLSADVSLSIEAIAVDADATASFGSTITATYITPSNQTVAESSSAAQIPAGTVCECTFAPFLPDTAAVGALANESQLQTGLVLTELAGGSTVEVVAT